MPVRVVIPLALAALLAAAHFFFEGIRLLVLLTVDDLPGWVLHDATGYGIAALGMALAIVLGVAAVALLLPQDRD